MEVRTDGLSHVSNVFTAGIGATQTGVPGLCIPGLHKRGYLGYVFLDKHD